MPSKRSNSQAELINSAAFDPIANFNLVMGSEPPWESIVDFATHRSFCNQKLYPRQLTLLKLIYLETDHMTAYDLDVIEQWREGFRNPDMPEGVNEDIWTRIEYLKARGYRHFPHIEAIIGRRGSKGKIGGLLGCEKMAYMFSLDNWQKHYGVSPGKDGYLSVVATNSIQAKKFQFADIRETVESCKYLQPHIAELKDYTLAIRTPADVRRIAYMHKNKIPIEHQVATLHAVAMSSNSSSGRGATGFANFFDEFAHMISGTGSQRSSEEVYEAYQPSLDQFGTDSLTYIPSSPFCLAPETPVLTEDLRWVPVGSLQLGDKLIGFDEHAPSEHGVGRRWRQTEVVETSIIQAPRYRLITDSGKSILCTGEHLWLMSEGNHEHCWRKTSEIKPGMKIKALGTGVWDEDDSRGAGYLAGFFDAEGCLSTPSLKLSYGQNVGPIHDGVERLLKARGFDTSIAMRTNKRSQLAVSRVMGGVPEVLRFLGEVRPKRLLNKFPEKFYGTSIRAAANTTERVVSVELEDHGPVVALGTSTHTLVADQLLSHNTMTGHFYSLYEQGRVLMRDYDPETGTTRVVERTEKELGYSDGEVEGNLIELTANPEMLVVQLPSWGLYEDWKKSPKLGGPYIKRPIQAYDERMMRYERSNPQKFAVERRSQFASVMDAFLDPKKVDAMFNNVPWRDPSVLAEQVQGRLDRRYYAHVDPGLTNANFAFTIGHLEDAPEDLDPEGVSWPHVIIDYMKVWKAKDFPDNTIDYVKVQREIAEVLRRFPSMVEFSADQWNSAGMLAALREEFGTRMTVRQETFTETANQERMERFKSALNLGWIHAYKDDFYEGGQKFAASDTAQSLLGMECKFLQRKPNGKVDKQDIGPVTTKDLFDTVNVVTDRMLKDHLDLWQAKMLGVQSPAIGSTDVAGLRSGRDLDRLAAMQRRPGGVVPVGVGSANMSAREKLRQQSLDRAFAKRMNSGGYTSRLRGHR